MGKESHCTPPDAVDMAAAERAIRRAGAIAFAAFAAADTAAVRVLPGLFVFPDEVARRTAFDCEEG